MSSDENFLNYTAWKITFTLHNGSCDKHLSAVINENKSINFFLSGISKSEQDYTITQK